MGIGADIGTYNLVVNRRTPTGDFAATKEVNAFITIELENPFTFNMMEKSGVKIIKRDKTAYVLGQDAVNVAYSMNLPIKRPMENGCVNPTEKQSFSILSTMIHSLIGKIENDGEILCYCVPAPAINADVDVDYHQKVLKTIFDKYEVNGKKLNAFHISEALALIYAELMDKQLTGIACSFGSGMVNVCVANMGVPAVNFSIVNSGDWIDKQVAKVTGESQTFVNTEKTKVDLTRQPTSMVERAVQMQYRIMMEKTVRLIKEKIQDVGSKVRTEKPMDIILAGGVSSPNGFETMFKEVVQEVGFPIEIGEIRKPQDPLYAVSRGCLIAAEASA